jgi:hypothetical protein
VDTLFVYSWFLSLLVGNSNILRLPSTTSPQLDLVIEVINTLLADNSFSAIRSRTLLVRYGHDDEVTRHFSRHCDVRVIWGGDATVAHIRSIPLPATATELVFADKFSLAVMDAAAFLRSNDRESLVHNFYNDAYWFGQMACSSPRLVIWRGKAAATRQAREQFWPLVEEKIQASPPEISAADVMNKVVASCLAGMDHGDVGLVHDARGAVHRIEVASLAAVNEEVHCGAGLFFETCIEELDDLAGFLTRRHQSVTSFGIAADEWREFLRRCRPQGIDRIVPPGRALDFSATWDGLDLLREFCREAVVAV